MSTPSGRHTRTKAVDRRAFLATAGAGTTLALAGCLGDDDPADDDGEPADDGDDADDDWDESDLEGTSLDVTVWSGTYGQIFEDEVATIYEEEYGVDLNVHHEWAEILANIRAAPEDDPPYDVTITDGNFYYLGMAEDLYLPIREENVPNMQEAYPYLLETRSHEYGVPVDVGPMALMWTDEFEAENGHPEEFSDFLTEEIQEANTAMEGSGAEYPLYTAAIASERGVDAIYDEDWDYIFDTLGEMNIDEWVMGGADLWEWFRTEAVEFAQYYTASGWVESQDQDDWHMHFPEENLAYLDHFCVVRGTDKRRAAEHYINWLASEDCQQPWADQYPQLMANQNVEYGDFGGIEENFPTTNEEWEEIQLFDWEFLIDHYGEVDDQFQEQLVEG